jgi:hypothetical protein
MPLVFVHGVAVRYDPPDDPYVAARDALFRRFVLSELVDDPRRTSIINPYWGDVAARFPWNHGGLPGGRYEAFGADDLTEVGLLELILRSDLPGSIVASDVTADRILATTAEHSLGAAVDALWAAAGTRLSLDLAAPLAELAAQTVAYADANPSTDWIASVRNDSEFSGPYIEAFGFDDVRDRLREAVVRLREAFVRIRGRVSSATADGVDAARQAKDDLLLLARTPLHRTLITFLGDAFVYFHERDASWSTIGDRVTIALRQADADREKTGEPLVVVAHSMGGNIVYDLLTSTLGGLHVDTFVTVGSQVAVIEELKLFASSDRTIPSMETPKVRMPHNIGRWINVFDTLDVLGFAAERVFDGVEDFRFRTGHMWAHGGYFVEPTFHQRLAKRLKKPA